MLAVQRSLEVVQGGGALNTCIVLCPGLGVHGPLEGT